MTPTDVASQAQADAPARQRAVNDFSIQVATVNGSGSQTANLILIRSIFQMGVPVSGKNLFPSNIAGLPTWYTIRANKDGYIGRKKEIDLVVTLNPETAREDALTLDSISSGAGDLASCHRTMEGHSPRTSHSCSTGYRGAAIRSSMCCFFLACRRARRA